MSPRVAKALRERAKRERKSVSSTINELLETALEVAEPAPEKKFKIRTFNSGGLNPGYEAEKLKDYLAQMDIQDYLDANPRH